MEEKREIIYSDISSASRKQPYDAMVYLDKGKVIAVDSNGKVIATGTAGTDDATVIQAAINNISGGTISLYGNFTLSAQITAVKNLTFVGIGRPTITANVATGTDLFYLTGAGMVLDLGSDVSAGDRTITASDGSVFEPGYLVKVYDDTIFNPADWPTYKTGELHHVSAVSGNTLTFDDLALHTYTVGSNGKVNRISPRTYAFYDIDFVGQSSTADYRGIHIFYAKNCIFSNCTFSNFGLRAIRISDCYNTVITKCKIYNSNLAGYGYGIEIAHSTAYTRISDCDISSCRHAITHGSSGGPGQARDTMICGNVIYATEGISSVIDAHGIVESMYVIGNVIVPAISTYAVKTGAMRTIISNNIIYGNICTTRNSITGIEIVISNNHVVGDATIYSDDEFDARGETASLVVKNNTCSSGNTLSLGSTKKTTTMTISGNIGYVTENSGAAATVADGGTIAHGCATAPTKVTLTGSVAGEMVTITSIDATNITVAIKKPDNSAGTTQTVYWRAEV